VQYSPALLELIEEAIQSKEDPPKVVDRLLPHIPPASGEGREVPPTFRFSICCKQSRPGTVPEAKDCY
jgi:hypothetical protein